jgi:hypothetical protein
MPPIKTLCKIQHIINNNYNWYTKKENPSAYFQSVTAE